MAHSTGRAGRVVEGLAELTGRSDAEVKLTLTVTAAAAGIALAVGMLKILVDLGPPPHRHPGTLHR